MIRIVNKTAVADACAVAAAGENRRAHTKTNLPARAE